MSETTYPVVVIGAGPVGLAAAAELAERRLPFVVLEAGDSVGAAVRQWGHVRLFSPWRYNVAPAAERLLAAAGWQAPDPDEIPTGADIADRYLAPLAALPALAPHIRTGARVAALTRRGIDKLTDRDRAAQPFSLRLADGERILARAVIDASGTWGSPNPLGLDGLSVPGEADAADRIAYGIPDVLAETSPYAGAHTLVVGGGHSAMNVVLDLLALQERAPETRITWALRHDRLAKIEGGGLNDKLPARGDLGRRAVQAIADGRVTLLAPFGTERLRRDGAALTVHGLQGETPVALAVDRIVVATGFRPDVALLREVRAALDPSVEAPPALAPLIDPNLHSCGTVPPHGVAELSHPEPGFYIAGMKSYGRAPTFLMATGYEQVRSIVAELAGDHAAAREVRLVLPETGVCSAPALPQEAAEAGAGCCGGPAPAAVDACCAADATAKAAGKAGCGCSEAPAKAAPAPTAASRCCGTAA